METGARGLCLEELFLGRGWGRTAIHWVIAWASRQAMAHTTPQTQIDPGLAETGCFSTVTDTDSPGGVSDDG